MICATASIGTFWVIVGFHLLIVALLALDLGVFHRRAHVVGMAEAALWSILWVALALGFAGLIYFGWHWWHPGEPDAGPEKAFQFLAGFLVEKSLSVDNLFVFMVIFRYFGVPPHLQHRVLFWGVVGAIIMRALFILAGGWLISQFYWILYLFGLFLIYTGIKLLFSVEEEIDPGRNLFLRWAQRILPFVESYDSDRFWVKRMGKWHATPLTLVLLVVETTDVMFALDSIPAVFVISTDLFVVYTSNIFAILGLRALYFLIAPLLGMFRYLHIGLAVVLTYLGAKMLAKDVLWHWWQVEISTAWSLAIIGTILGATVFASLLAGPREVVKHPPEAVSLAQPEEEQARTPSADTCPTDGEAHKDPPAQP
ncbi:MAG: hypothetical protein C4297_11075 [Gemmataceae bacterium]